MIKFRFSKKATKIDDISTLNRVKSKMEISSIFVAFLENLNFNVESSTSPEAKGMT